MSFQYAIIGLGKTGVSCFRYLTMRKNRLVLIDSNPFLPVESIRSMDSNVTIHLGSIPITLLRQAEYMIVSPGIRLDDPAIQQARDDGVKLISDLDLFFQEKSNAMFVGITGSNGKSTVTSLITDMAQAVGIRAACGGNIGIPVLDLCLQPSCDLYILELSSFQLERLSISGLDIGIFLNLTEDHLDFHGSFERYRQAKRSIIAHCSRYIYNREDRNTWPLHPTEKACYSFTCSTPNLKEFGVIDHRDGYTITYGKDVMVSCETLKIKGRHNWANIAASLTLGTLFGWPTAVMLDVVRNFPGLPHRCQWVAHRAEADWFNDSKGTNEAASIAAIRSLAFTKKKRIILIAGGDGKAALFHDLAEEIVRSVCRVILFGKDKNSIAKAIGTRVPVYIVHDLEAAVQTACLVVQKGDYVLLSPACTSWDMFSNYKERGEQFTKLVHGISL